jgi:hypothetical protein
MMLPDSKVLPSLDRNGKVARIMSADLARTTIIRGIVRRGSLVSAGRLNDRSLKLQPKSQLVAWSAFCELVYLSLRDRSA